MIGFLNISLLSNAQTTARPNILIIMTDQQTADAMSIAGNKDLQNKVNETYSTQQDNPKPPAPQPVDQPIPPSTPPAPEPPATDTPPSPPGPQPAQQPPAPTPPSVPDFK